MGAHPDATDILIVGAGPTGLALAAELRRLGAAPLIVDKHPAQANTSRAVVIHARTLEVLAPLGVTRTLLEQGLTLEKFRARSRDRVLLTLDFGTLESAFPFVLICPQDRTEAILLGELTARGGVVQRPAELAALRQEPSFVEASISADAGAQSVRARYVVGCDGMHSVVREAAGVSFAGKTYAEEFVLADVRMHWPIGREEVSLFLDGAGLVLVVPMPGERFRVIATASNAPRPPDAAMVQAILDACGPRQARAEVGEVLWSSRFRVHHRIAASPRAGRVLLCGDAAHVHSPAGGQGMNTGIQDAISLAPALLAALGGDEAALDAWAASRHRIAEGVLAQTDRMMRFGTISSLPGRLARDAALGLVGFLPPVGRAIARSLAELDNR